MAKLTDQERAELKARLDQEWWDEWWARDFSWAGLAALDEHGNPIHPWQGWSITPDGQVMEREDPALPDESRDATLQDYWRWNGQSLLSDENLLAAGLLEDNDDQPRFHICHLPERWQDGSDSWKERPSHPRWETVETELAHRVNTAVKGEAEKTGSWDSETLIGPDRRTQLSGAQIQALPRPEPSQDEEQSEAGAYHLRADYTRWLEDTDFGQAVFGSPTRFDNAQFSGGNANFYKAQFSGGHSSFNLAQFSGGDAAFSHAQFSGGYASFIQTQFSGGYAEFGEAQFSGGHAYFEDAQFSGGDAEFGEAQFSGGHAYFQGAEFSGGDTDFHYAQFSGGYTDFRDAQFSGGNAHFYNAQFSAGYADFEDAQFSGGNASFQFAQFSGGEALFRSVEFAHSAGFNGLNPASAEDPKDTGPEQVRSHFNFSGSQFKGRAEWIDARFPGTAVFADVIFEEDCFFGQARQSLEPGRTLELGSDFQGPTSFRNALFKRTADFARSSFPKRAEDRNGLFENCRFNEVLDLKGVERLPFSAFQGIRLDQGLSVDPVHPMEDQFEQALEDAQSAAKRDETAREADGYEPLEDPERERRGADNRFAALEAGCRVLKTQMAAAEDKVREQQFFSYEIRAREHRTKHALADKRSEMRDKVRDHPTRIHARWHRLRAWLLPQPNRQFQLWASQRYGRISHYGGSVTAPLATLIKTSFWILLAYIGFAVVSGWSGSRVLEDICWGMACGDTVHPFVFELVEAVTKGALGPFRLLAGRGEVFGYLGDGAPLFRGVIMAGMLVHGLLSSALVFLSLLALRRNFQIN